MGNLADKLTTKSPEFKNMFLGQFPEQQLKAGNTDKYYQTLTDFDFISLKINYTQLGIEALIKDYDLIENPEILELLADDEQLTTGQIKTLKLIQRTLELSAYILNEHPHQLVGQLWGRLQSCQNPDIQKLLQDAAASKSEIPRFIPIKSSLNTPDGKLLRTLKGHDNAVRAVAITPDGKKAVSGSDDKTLKLWNLETYQEICTLTGHENWVRSVTITPDGKKAVSSSDDNTLKLWDLERRKEISNFTGDTSIISCAVSPDGLMVVAGEQSGRVHFLHLEGI
ncbi:MAG: hypothetical protein RLZZ507_374 [Cyanobacteriota bacterium]|jgi:WD40 repeat protein